MLEKASFGLAAVALWLNGRLGGPDACRRPDRPGPGCPFRGRLPADAPDPSSRSVGRERHGNGGLIEAGFAHVEVIDSGADLNAYAKVENPAGCSPPAARPLPAVAESACCTPSPASRGPSSDASACCPAPATEVIKLAVAGSSCCTPSPTVAEDLTLHERLAELLRRYDVNDFAASVKVFAVKPV